MTQHWQEILPIDRYTVSADGLLHDYDRKTLTLLYQPLIGATCFSLYMTLWAQLEDNRIWSTPFTHHSLMTILDLNLKAIFDARLKLEGIGLLKTFVHCESEERSFVYQLQPPLTPEQFFLDGMLNVYLFGKIGKNQYIRMKNFFSDEKLTSETPYKEVTKSFEDVFASSSFPYENDRLQHLHDDNKQFIGRKDPKGVEINTFQFNFELLFAGIKETLIPREAFNHKVMEAINKLAFLYGIEPLEMTNIVISSVTIDNEIDIEELRKAARDWYQFENNDRLPTLIDKTQPLIHCTNNNNTPKTQEAELIYYLETTSPRQLLKDLSGGAEPSLADLKIVEDVMFQQKLLPGVINVLLQYVMIRTDMKLSKAYIEKIASHWSRKKIQTVKDAMELAKSEHRQYVEWQSGNKQTSGQRRKQIRSEKLPDWFVEQKKAETKATQEQTLQDDDFDFETEKRKLEERLKKYKK